VILVDTSFLVAIANGHDRYHAECLALAATIKTGFFVPVTVLPEAAYLIYDRLGHHVMREFVRQMNGPNWTIEAVQANDLGRTLEILEKYQDNNLDFVDATLIAIAERLHIQQVLTLDQRQFRVIRPAHCATFEILPQI
jgi:predicted nucleic acid-binding protein